MSDTAEPICLPREAHPISRAIIDDDVLGILYKLKRAGYEAYVVGGAVRDILRGQRPKDFDIATNATPRELRHLFRNSRTVGRRFRLVHVFFGDKNIEVATLRSMVDPPEDPDGDMYVEDDNQWGDLESDSFRRDFTINALFYNIADFTVIDYTGGVEDLERKLIRCIGDPWVRFREDPVRMLRAIKFAARFQFTIEPETRAAIAELPAEIHKASRFRVTEEIFRILIQPHCDDGLQMLYEFGFLHELFPTWIAALGDDGFEQIHEYFARVHVEGSEGCYYPVEILAAGLFLPLLGHIDPSREDFSQVSARITEEVRQLGIAMDLPKRLMNAVYTLLRGILYLLFFHHRSRRVQRFVQSPEFDWVWQVYELGFQDIEELRPIGDIWRRARERVTRPHEVINDRPEHRDIFSFRGRTGGGRLEYGMNPSPLLAAQGEPRRKGSSRRRRRRRRN